MTLSGENLFNGLFGAAGTAKNSVQLPLSSGSSDLGSNSCNAGRIPSAQI
jgi:hypothetical protein